MSDDFNFDGKPAAPRRSGMQALDILSIVVLIATACLAGFFVWIFINPESGLNPLPPGVGLGPRAPTATVTPLQLEPTWTASPTLVLTPSSTPRPTFTPFGTNTPFSLLPPTKTPKPPTPTRTPKAPFSATVNYIQSTIFYPELGCAYFGVAGEAVDVNNTPFKFGIVKLGGTLDGQTVDPETHTTVTGVATQFGQAGFEIVLNVPPTNSTKTLWIQLFDVAGLPQSERIEFNTYDDCQRNLIQVRFKANK